MILGESTRWILFGPFSCYTSISMSANITQLPLVVRRSIVTPPVQDAKGALLEALNGSLAQSGLLRDEARRASVSFSLICGMNSSRWSVNSPRGMVDEAAGRPGSDSGRSNADPKNEVDARDPMCDPVSGSGNAA